MRFLRRQRHALSFARTPGLTLDRTHDHRRASLSTRRGRPFAADLTLLRLEVARDTSTTPPCARRADGRP